MSSVGIFCNSNKNVMSEVIRKNLQDHFQAHLADSTRKFGERVEELASKLDAEVCGLQDSLKEVVEMTEVIYKTLQDHFEARLADVTHKFEVCNEKLSSKLNVEVCDLQDSLKYVVERAGNIGVKIPDVGDSNRLSELVSCEESLQRSCHEPHGQSSIAVQVGAEQRARNVGSSSEPKKDVTSEVIHKNVQDHFEARLTDITRKFEVCVENLSSKLDAEVCGLQRRL